MDAALQFALGMLMKGPAPMLEDSPLGNFLLAGVSTNPAFPDFKTVAAPFFADAVVSHAIPVGTKCIATSPKSTVLSFDDETDKSADTVAVNTTLTIPALLTAPISIPVPVAQEVIGPVTNDVKADSGDEKTAARLGFSETTTDLGVPSSSPQGWVSFQSQIPGLEHKLQRQQIKVPVDTQVVPPQPEGFGITSAISDTHFVPVPMTLARTLPAPIQEIEVTNRPAATDPHFKLPSDNSRQEVTATDDQNPQDMPARRVDDAVGAMPLHLRKTEGWQPKEQTAAATTNTHLKLPKDQAETTVLAQQPVSKTFGEGINFRLAPIQRESSSKPMDRSNVGGVGQNSLPKVVTEDSRPDPSKKSATSSGLPPVRADQGQTTSLITGVNQNSQPTPVNNVSPENEAIKVVLGQSLNIFNVARLNSQTDSRQSDTSETERATSTAIPTPSDVVQSAQTVVTVATATPAKLNLSPARPVAQARKAEANRPHADFSKTKGQQVSAEQDSVGADFPEAVQPNTVHAAASVIGNPAGDQDQRSLIVPVVTNTHVQSDSPVNTGSPIPQHPNVFDSDTHDDSIPGTRQTLVNTAKLVQGLSQSEFRVGMQSREFGNIDIRTSVARHVFTAQISVEHGDVAKTLATELPGLYDRLADQRVPVGSILIHNHDTTMSSGSGQGSQQQTWSPRNSSLTKAQAEPVLPAIAEASQGNGRLDIRI